MAGQGGGRHRRPFENPAARRHQPERRRLDPVRRHLPGWHVAGLRRVRPAQPEAGLREGDRQAAQHGLAELGRRAPILHQLPARQLGQEGRGRAKSLYGS
jgi:hypothetical protein